MKTWLVVILLLGVAGGAGAQETAVAAAARESDSADTLPATSWAMALSSSSNENSSHANDFFLAPELRLSFTGPAAPEFAAATMAVPMASPAPVPKHHNVSGADDYRLQIAMGFTYVRFRSAAFDASMYGLNTSVVYFPNHWLGVEGNFTAAFGRNVFKPTNDQTRYAGITGG